MEYGIRLARVGTLPSDPREICQAQWRDALPAGTLRALYFGTEFCEDLLPGSDEAEAFCNQARDAGLEAVLMTPMVTPRGLQRVDHLLAKLAGRGWTPTVSFNDWGVLALLRTTHTRSARRAGRLLNRGLRDPRLAQQAPQPVDLTQNRGERQQALLLRCGVVGLETDPDLQGNYLPKVAVKLQRTLHLPYAFAVSGRNCLIKAETLPAEASFSKGLGQSCPGRCRERCLSENRPDTPLPLWRAGNTLFYEVAAASAAAHLERCDRIVLHERPLP